MVDQFVVGAIHGMANQSRLLTSALILVTTSLTFGLPAKSEETYEASCKARGDAITLTTTGESVLEQRLVKFKPIDRYEAQLGQRGVCVMKQDPPGYRWISCWKKGERFAAGDFYNPTFIRPSEAVVNSVLYRGWAGACKVKLSNI